jgi:pilus assembly protein Flp/PilA
MRTFARAAINFLKKEDGPTAVECALMLGLIVVVCIVAINSLNSNSTVKEPEVVAVAGQ